MENSSQKSLRFNEIVEILIIPATNKVYRSFNRRKIVKLQRSRAEKTAPSTRDRKKTTKSLTCISKRISEIRVFKGNYRTSDKEKDRKLTRILFRADHGVKGRSPSERERKILEGKQAKSEETTSKSKFDHEIIANKGETSDYNNRNLEKRVFEIDESKNRTKRSNCEFARNVLRRIVKNVRNVLIRPEPV